jgi:hypothetical protein
MTTADETRAYRAAGWAGIVFSVLSLIVLPLAASPLNPPPPVLGASGAEYASWYGLHRTGFLVGNYLGILAFVPGFVQLVVLAARVKRVEGEHGWMGSLVLCTGTFAYAVFACSLVVFQALPFLAERRLEAANEAMGALGAVWFALDGLAALPLVLAVAWATTRTGALPRWFGRTSWVVSIVAAAMSLGGLTSTPAWLAGGGAVTAVGFIGFFVWTTILSVIFLRLKPA